MTETKNHHADERRNGDVMAETSTADDVFDDTYKEKAGKPPIKFVWRNIFLMSLLHTGALYGLVFIPSASFLTLVWSKYFTNT